MEKEENRVSSSPSRSTQQQKSARSGWVGGVRGGHRSPTLSGSRHTALSKLFSSPEPEATDDQFNAIGFKLGVCVRVRVVACVLWHEPRLPARGDLELSRD